MCTPMFLSVYVVQICGNGYLKVKLNTTKY